MSTQPSKKSPASCSSSPPSLELRRISKRFGETRALSEADLVVFPGEIHALLGENGAGKTTLVSIAAGRLTADSGEVLRGGAHVSFRKARDARLAGLVLVPQHDLLIGAASVADNLAFLDSAAPFFESAGSRRARVARLARAFGLELGDADARADALPVGTRQRIEVAGALAGDPDVLILDEPTAVLSPDETSALFASLRKRADAGAAVVLITHRLAEVFAGADRLTLLARGRSVKTCRISETTPEEIGGLLLKNAEGAVRETEKKREKEEEKIFIEGVRGARPLELRGDMARGRSQTHPSKHAARSAAQHPDKSLALTGFAPNVTSAVRAEGISLSLSPGELLVLLAIDGNGADDIARAIAGLEPFSGRVEICGVTLPSSGNPLVFRAAGGAFVPADRREEGLVATLSLSENLALPNPPGRVLLDRAAMRTRAEERLGAFGVRFASPDVPAGSLSGGNQQKVVLARELARDPAILIAVHPTRGLDLASAAAVRSRILDACCAGSAALVVTADPDEAQLFDAPIRVVYRGRLSGELAPTTPAATLGRLMAGLEA
ncbi:MAG TPA: ATP-binding cassette domain-containing protein [Thermoanaerobaculia bacterium]|nr:ATP-binding cassette domain-containing protein [Thermoanaerobaculia bacterium]